LTCALTYPTVRYPGQVGRFDTGDGRFSIWNVAWVAHSLLDNPRHLFDANIFYPHPATLTYSELNLFAGALATPAYAASRNPIAAHNSAVLLCLLIAFLTMWALVRRLTGSADAALISAAGYTFCAYTAAHTAEIQLLMIFGFPLVMVAFHRVRDRPSPAAGVYLGAALAATALASGYFGVFAAGLVGAATLLWARPDRRYWIAIACAALVAVGLVGTVLVPYLRDRAAAGPLRTTRDDELRLYSASVRDYLTSGTMFGEAGLRAAAALKHAALPRLSLPRGPEVLFPGIVIGVLAAVGLARGVLDRGDRRTIFRYAVIALLAAWASLGPAAGLYVVMMKILPGISQLRAPARLGIIVTFALAVLAGFGYRRLQKPNERRWLTPICLAGLVIELWVPWPLQGMPPPERAYRVLATLPPAGVVELPFPYIPTDFHQHTRAMVRSMVNWQPLLNGYSDFIPPDFTQLALPVNGFPDVRSFEILRAHGVRYVILRLAEYREFRQQMLDRFPPFEKYLQRLADEQDVRLYEIVSWPEGVSTP
jgi:4-amino-4-deoxy-L-arabinose transferase-like glycosyltransferase